jgi:hypothetical protein
MNWRGTFSNTIAGKDSMHDLMDPDGLPLMSDDKSFQVAAIRNMPNETRVWVLSWDPQDEKFFTAAAWSLSLRERTLDGKASDVQQAPIPDPVRDEMGENGLLKPPKNVAWRVLTFPSASSGTWRITATTPDRKDQIVFVPSFTNPVPTEK